MLTPTGFVNLAHPINWDHPDAQGLNAMWLSLPGMVGGAYVVDLAHMPSDGKAGYNAVWTNNPRPQIGRARPGWPCSITIDANNNRLNCGTPNTTTSSFSFMVWVLFDGSQVAFPTPMAKSTNGQNCDLLWNGTTPTFFLTTSGSGNASVAANTTDQKSETWYHYACVWDASGGAINIHINGKFEGTAAATGTRTDTGTWSLGWSNVFGRDIVGFIDDARVYNRALGAKQIESIYETTLLGYPGFVNRIGLPRPILVALSSGSATAASGSWAVQLGDQGITPGFGAVVS